MAYETKVILALLAERIAMSDTIEEAYEAIRRSANVEGLDLPPYADFIKSLKKK